MSEGTGDVMGIAAVWHYWAVPGRFAAGEYPVSNAGQAADRLRSLLAEGIDTFIDLTCGEKEGLPPYQELAASLGAALGIDVQCYREAIPDMTVPLETLVSEILDTISSLLADGRVVYLHCCAGLGRTGTVVGCWLARGGLKGSDALRRLRDLTGRMDSPETPGQRRLVREWSRRDSLIMKEESTTT